MLSFEEISPGLMRSSNAYYDASICDEIRVSICTVIYNRRRLFPRILRSIENQTYDKFEYIIVNNGSEELLDDLAEQFMNRVGFPVVYLKNERNHKLHVGRQITIDQARGELMLRADSDDEFTPDFAERCIESWDSIPVAERNSYYSVRYRCFNDSFELDGRPLPSNINQLSSKKQIKVQKKIGGVWRNAICTALVKRYRFPEPKSVSLIAEGYINCRAAEGRKSWYIDIPLQIYHCDSGDSITNDYNVSLQIARNEHWSICDALNNRTVYSKYERFTIKKTVFLLFKLSVLGRILKKYSVSCDEGLKNNTNRMIYVMFYIFFSKVFVPWYEKRMDKDTTLCD